METSLRGQPWCRGASIHRRAVRHCQLGYALHSELLYDERKGCYTCLPIMSIYYLSLGAGILSAEAPTMKY